jgi:hypothetical protein
MDYQPSNVLRYAGDVNIERITLTTSKGVFQDITAQVINVQFYEDLFSPFLSGSLVLKDALDLVNVLPFIGEEFVDLEISTPTLPVGKIKGRFHVYKMTDRLLVGDRAVAYQLHFMSIESLVDTNKKISKVYSGKISDIVTTFIRDKNEGFESEKNVYVEPTRNSIKYISNYWSPVKNLSFLADNSLSENKSPSYIFFENRDGFYFVSMESLYKHEPTQEFVFDRYTRDEVPMGGNALNVIEDYKRISEYSIPTAFDYMDRIRSGLMASKLFSYDSTKKTYTAKNYVAASRFGSQNHLNKFPIFSDSASYRANANLINYNRAFETFTSFGDTTNARIVQERISFMKMAEANKMNITVAGRTDYTVGQVVKVSLNKMQPIAERETEDDFMDQMFSGKYLVAAINHYITRDQHECHMELIKDSSIKDFSGKQ